MPVSEQHITKQFSLLPRYTNYHRGQEVEVICFENILVLQLSATKEQRWQWSPDSRYLEGIKNADYPGLLCALEYLFGQMHSLHQVTLVLEPSLQSLMLQCGSGYTTKAGEFIITSQIFWQLNELWVMQRASNIYPQYLTMSSQGYRHPIRPAKGSGIVYRRYIPWLQQTFSLRTLVIEKDLEKFHRWMHHPRVNTFWQQADSQEKLREYLLNLERDAHCQTLIGCFDDIPFAYVETYWTKEDRISPYYTADNYDRGWHLLVGEEGYRGKSWFTAWFPSLQHYLFLDDPRTQCIVAEPRYDNTRLLRNALKTGFGAVKTFDFPHKRAQLLMLLRENFFQGNYIHPKR